MPGHDTTPLINIRKTLGQLLYSSEWRRGWRRDAVPPSDVGAASTEAARQPTLSLGRGALYRTDPAAPPRIYVVCGFDLFAAGVENEIGKLGVGNRNGGDGSNWSMGDIFLACLEDVV